MDVVFAHFLLFVYRVNAHRHQSCSQQIVSSKRFVGQERSQAATVCCYH